MEWPEVLQRIEAGEGEETEFKRGLGDFSAIGRAVCAFANTEGGIIILGITDILGVTDSQSIIGVKEDADEVQERLETFLRTGCSAPVSGECGSHEDPNGWVHWIEISHQDYPEPLRYDGRVWVRRECSSVEPSPSELQELYNTSDKPSSENIR